MDKQTNKQANEGGLKNVNNDTVHSHKHKKKTLTLWVFFGVKDISLRAVLFEIPQNIG